MPKLARTHRTGGLPPIASICGLLVLLLGRPDPAVGQERDCTGWAVSCASVQVHADGDRLVFYVPNAVRPMDSVREGSGVPTERVRVFRDADGMTCDPTSGQGCLDVTAEWVANSDGTDRASLGSGAAAGSADPGIRDCDGEGRHLDPARGLDPDEGRRCGQPIAGYFILALPASAFLFAADGGEPEVVLPVAGDPGAFGEDDGTGSDGGNAGSGDDSSGGGDSGSGGEAGGSGTGGGGDANGGGTGSGGETGGGGEPGGGGSGSGTGDSGSGGGFGDLPPGGGLPSGGDDPGMGGVPEPISTTLFGIGLLGYAGARLRQRANGEPSDEGA